MDQLLHGESNPDIVESKDDAKIDEHATRPPSSNVSDNKNESKV